MGREIDSRQGMGIYTIWRFVSLYVAGDRQQWIGLILILSRDIV
jgi:hypothetical protein